VERPRKGPIRRTAAEGTCAGMRAGVHDEVSRARGCDHVSLSKWHRHHRSRKRAKARLYQGTPGESAKTPRTAEPRTFSRRADAKRSRPNPKLFSRKIATRGSEDGDRGVRGGAQRATRTGRERPTPASSSHRSAHGVVKTPSAPVSRRSRGVARRHGRRDETRSPHDTMGARFRIRG